MIVNIEKSFFEWWEKHEKEYNAILFDVDGTLIAGEHTTPGAEKFIDYLRKIHFPFTLITNDGNRSIAEKCKLMEKRGLKISHNELISCGSALQNLAETKGYVGKKFFAMGELGNPDFAELAGMIVERDPDKIDNCHGIIIGEGIYNWQLNINAVLNYFILNTERKLMIVPNPDSYWPSGKNGGIGIGAGGKARFICTILKEYGIKIKPVYLGKPYNPIYRHAIKHLHKNFNIVAETAPEKIIMLGDSLASDIKGANKMRFTSALVLTGITNMNHVKKANKQSVPDFIFEKI